MKPPLLFYLSAARDFQRFAVGPALARGAERAGWGFECYYDDLRRGRHFGGGDPDASGWAGGSLVAGGQHAELVFWLATRYELVALGDPQSLLWPVLDAVGAEALVRTSDPAELYGAAFARLALPVPQRVLVLDAQGVGGVVAAPYLYPEFLADGDALGIDVTSGEVTRQRIEELGGKEVHGVCLDPDRAKAFPRGLD